MIVTTGNTFQKEYFVGDEFDPTGMEITATYTYGPDKELTIADCELSVTGLDSDKKFTEAGTQTITVTYTENGITKYDTVTVEVKANTHTITMVYNDGLGSGEESVTVEDNGSAEIVVTPKTGYQIKNLQVTETGATVEQKGNTVKVSNVQSDITITVYFEAIEYTVTVVTEGGDNSCTVAPKKGTVSVENPNFEFTVTVSEDYSAQAVVTCGSAYVVRVYLKTQKRPKKC